jgi:hypothetical protein
LNLDLLQVGFSQNTRQVISDRSGTPAKMDGFYALVTFNELTLEDVIPICLQMIQNSLEVCDVPRGRKLQRVKGFEDLYGV